MMTCSAFVEKMASDAKEVLCQDPVMAKARMLADAQSQHKPGGGVTSPALPRAGVSLHPCTNVGT